MIHDSITIRWTTYEISNRVGPLAKTASDELLKQLPDPNGTLSKTVPPSAIRMANDEVSKAVEGKSETTTAEPRGTQSRPNRYLILTPAQRFEVGKRAAEHGVNSITSLFFEKVSTSSSN